MRRKIAALLLSGLTALTAVPVMTPERDITISVSAMDSMPKAFDSEADRSFSRPCESRFDDIPAELRALVPEGDVQAWINFNDVLRTETAGSLMEYPNTYSFIKIFDLSEETVRTAMEPVITAAEPVITAEELDLILTGSETDILGHFKTEYPMVSGDRFYTAQWLYDHTTAEYAEAGITPEMVTEKLEIYPDYPFRPEAAAAFSDKLYSYVGSAAGMLEWGFVCGDMDHDGSISVTDAVQMQQYLLKMQDITYSQWLAADMNGDNCVDIMDLGLLKRELLLRQSMEPKPVMLNVMECNQHPDYPTGCESVALYMLLKYYNTDVTIKQIVEALPKGPLPYTSNGRTYGPDPEKKFVGDPRNSSSYGVFNGPIAQVAEQFRSGAQTKTGAPLEDVIDLLDKGQPAVVWYTTNPDRGIVYRREWYDIDTGKLIRWPGGEHAVVVCGHDETNLTYRDPNTGGTVTMAQEKFREIYDELGGRIVYYNE